MTAQGPLGGSAPGEHARDRLFLSYAREDLAFVERLAAALSGLGLDIWVDTEGLFVGEEFWSRICTEIDRSTAVVCVVSRHSAQSVYCRREAEYAASRNKRMLPVVIQAVAATRLPEPIRVRHWLSFGDAGLFDQALTALVTAVRQDPEWIGEHTRLYLRAVDWEQGGRSASFCLRGRELDDAVVWLAAGSGKEPPVHPLHVEFIEASRQEDSDARERAERQARVSRSRALTTQAEVLRSIPGSSRLLPALLAAYGFREDPSPEAYAVLRGTLGFLPPCGPRLDHRYRVGTVCFSPDGSLLASAAGMTWDEEQQREVVRSARGPSVEDLDEYTLGMSRLRQEQAGRNRDAFVALVWDLGGRRQLVRLPHRGRVRAMTFLPDGSLFTACETGEGTIWSASSGQQLAVLTHPGPVWFIAVSPDGSRLLTVADEDPAGQQLAARVWVIAERREELRIPLGGLDKAGPYLRRELTSFAPCDRLEQLAVAFVDGSVKVLSLVSGAVVAAGETESLVYSMAFSRDHRYLALGEGSQARILDVGNFLEVARLPCAGAVELLRWNPGGNQLVTVSGNGAVGIASDIAVWAIDGSRKASFELINVRDVAVAPDGSTVAAAGTGSAVCIWDLGGAGLRAQLHFEDSANAVVYSPDGSKIAAGSDDLSARVWDTRYGLHLVRTALEDAFQFVELSADARYVAVASFSSCRVLEVASGAWLAQREGAGRDLRWSPDGSSIALPTDSGTILWRWASGEEVRLGREYTWAVTFSIDGRYLVTAGAARRIQPLKNGSAQIWRISDGRLMREVAHTDTVVAAAAHPDGVTFATAAGLSGGHDIIISRADPGRPVWVEIAASANDVAFSANGRVLAVGYRESGLGLFNAETGRLLASVLHLREVRAVEFGPDGMFLAVTTRGYSDRGAEVPATHLFRPDSRSQVDDEAEAEVILAGETFIGFVDSGSFLVTKDDSSVRVRATGSREVVASFARPRATAAISFRGGLVAQIEPGNLTVGRWKPDDLKSELRHRLPRDLSPDEWQEYMASELFEPLF